MRLIQMNAGNFYLSGYSQGGMFCYQAAAFRRSEGLASVIGLMFLATTHAQEREGSTEIVTWRELDGEAYAAKVPSFYFLEDVPVE